MEDAQQDENALRALLAPVDVEQKGGGRSQEAHNLLLWNNETLRVMTIAAEVTQNDLSQPVWKGKKRVARGEDGARSYIGATEDDKENARADLTGLIMEEF